MGYEAEGPWRALDVEFSPPCPIPMERRRIYGQAVGGPPRPADSNGLQGFSQRSAGTRGPGARTGGILRGSNQALPRLGQWGLVGQSRFRAIAGRHSSRPGGAKGTPPRHRSRAGAKPQRTWL